MEVITRGVVAAGTVKPTSLMAAVGTGMDVGVGMDVGMDAEMLADGATAGMAAAADTRLSVPVARAVVWARSDDNDRVAVEVWTGVAGKSENTGEAKVC